MKSYCKLLSLVLVFFAMSFAACDTPRTMAWHHYGYAQSKLEEGDLGTARSMAISLTGNQEYKDNKKYADKVDALLRDIEQAQGPCVDGYVFLYDAMCDESDEGHGYRWIPAGTFCLSDYTFPMTDCHSNLWDSDGVLYYCPPTQEDMADWVYSGYLTKEKFNKSTRPVKAYLDAPDSWPEGRAFAFRCDETGDVKKVRKLRINDPDAVLMLDDNGGKEPLYGKYVYVVDEYFTMNFGRLHSIFYREILEAYPDTEDFEQFLTVTDDGYFCLVDEKTCQQKPVSVVGGCGYIPEFSHLYFIDDSTITIDQQVYHKVEEQGTLVFDTNTLTDKAPVAVSVEASKQIAGWTVKDSYTETSDGGRHEYKVELLTDPEAEDLDFVAFHAIRISSAGRVQIVKCGEFHDSTNRRYNPNHRPSITLPLDNGCTLLLFEEDDRPTPPILTVFALKDGRVTSIYSRTGYLDNMDNRNKPQTIKLLESMKEADHEIMDGVMQFIPARYYYLTIEDGRLMRHDYK